MLSAPEKRRMYRRRSGVEAELGMSQRQNRRSWPIAVEISASEAAIQQERGERDEGGGEQEQAANEEGAREGGGNSKGGE
jgi:hypothetical protein